MCAMITPGQRRTAAARRARTEAKHLRWITELELYGYQITPSSEELKRRADSRA